MKALMSITALSVLMAGAAITAPAQAGVCQQDRALCQERNAVRTELKALFAAAEDGILSEEQYNQLNSKKDQAARIASDLRNMGFGRGFSRRYEQRSADLFDRTQGDSDDRLAVVANADDANEAEQMLANARAIELATEFLNSGKTLRQFKRSQRISWDVANNVAHFAGLKLMATSISCDRVGGMTRMRTDGYTAVAFVAGDKTRQCAKSAYDAGNLMIGALR